VYYIEDKPLQVYNYNQ